LIQKLKDRKPLLVTLLAFIFVILLCCILPTQIFYWTLCTDQDRNIPSNTEVLVSSCKRPTVVGVPGGEVLFVYEELTNKMYLLDLRTGEQRKIPNYPLFGNKGRIVFLDPNLVWVKPNYILDLTDGQSYELLDLRQYCCDNNKCCDNNGLNPVIYSYIQAADRVFIDPSGDKLIALSTDPMCYLLSYPIRIILEVGITMRVVWSFMTIMEPTGFNLGILGSMVWISIISPLLFSSCVCLCRKMIFPHNVTHR
jgi:hypothetical protein